MKTQTYGMSFMVPLPYIYHQSNIPPASLAQAESEKNWPLKYLIEARDNYRGNRENGTDGDSPSSELKFDGTAEWKRQSDGYWHVKYTEGPKDKAWMEERDRNYVFRLEHEGLLDEVEPNLRTEVPSLYQEIMASRVENKEECHLNCATSQPS